ncbi:hypothetical protein HMPREF9012_0116 [Bacteroidetes bacterium oral taxon 272 str. F0290]|nr:hypothetical protein HMPREF9012_0116 [Bacteroidetes bacterium oral taxon 272 str. F0290]
MRSFVIGLKTFSRHQPETFLIIYFFIFMMNLYLGNLNYKVKEGDLEELLSAYGAVTSAKIVKDRETGRSKGFGFVEMENEEEAVKAMTALNGTEYQGRMLVIKEALPKNA